MTSVMATSSAKVKRKVKGKTLNLNTFLGEDQDAPSGFTVVNTRGIDWGDAMENEELDDRYTLDFKREEKLVLPTAPKAARGPDIDLDKVPSRPPFTAFLGNLPYDVTEDDIVHFFRQLQVTNVRLPREGGEKGRLRGFGYAEFHDRQSLIEALALNNETLRNRSIKVSLAGEHDGDRERRDERNDRTMGDWRSGGREQFPRDESSRNGTYGFSNSRGYPDREPYRGRGGYDRDSNYSRDRYDRNERNSRQERINYGYNSDSGWDRNYSSDREQRYDRRFSDKSCDYNDRGPGRGGRNNRGNFRDNYSRRDDWPKDTRYQESRERDFVPRDGYESKRDEAESGEKDYPRERRKLQLKPRSKPIEKCPSPSETVSNSAIFGGAKPVDTAAREREIEERLAKEKEESLLHDQKERRDDPRSRRFSTSSAVSTRSRRSSESGPPPSYRDIFSEDDCLSQYKPTVPRQMLPEHPQYNTLPRVRQRCTSPSSTGSDRDPQMNSKVNRPPSGRRRDNFDSGGNFTQHDNSYERPQSKQSNTQSRFTDRSADGFRTSRNHNFYHDDSRERSVRLSTYEEPKPPVYTSANKFSHLLNDAEEVDRTSP